LDGDADRYCRRMWQEFLTAVALVLILEGVFPFLSPDRFRKTLINAVQLDDATLRFIGISSMIGGLLLLYWIR
jgi:uncharacterized protein YjeT (DUF2065 family)